MNPLKFWILSAKDGLQRHRFLHRNRADDGGEPIKHSHPVDLMPNRKTTPLKSVRVFSMSLFFTILSGFAVPSFAEDIEVYSNANYSGDAGAFLPNILFMWDTSSSMAWPAGVKKEFCPDENLDLCTGDEYQGYRCVFFSEGGDSCTSAKQAGLADKFAAFEGDEPPRLKELTTAMSNTLVALQNVANIGIGRFLYKDKNTGNDRDTNAPIILPVDFRGESDQSFSIAMTTSSTIRHSEDDAMQNVATGDMKLTSATLFVSDVVTITLGSATYEIRLDSVSNSGTTWKYHVKKISGPSGGLTSWVLGLAESCTVSNPVTPNKAQLKTGLSSGIGWDIDSNFSSGYFEFTLDQNYANTAVDLNINNSVTEQIVGPNCDATGGGGSSSSATFDPYSTIIVEGANQFKVSFVGVNENTNTWTYRAENLQGDPLKRWHLTGPDAGNWWSDCYDGASNITGGGAKYTGGKPFGLRWLSAGEVSFTLPKKYPVGYIKAWGSGTHASDSNPKPKDYMIEGNNSIFGPMCKDTTVQQVKTCVAKSSEGSCTQEQVVDYEISLTSFSQNTWTYHVKAASNSNNKILRDWRLELPISCVDKLDSTSPAYNALLDGPKIKWEVSESFTSGEFSIALSGDSLALNDNYIAGKVGGGFIPTGGEWNGFDIVGPGSCDIPQEHEASSCQLVTPDSGTMTICHKPYGDPDKAYTKVIPKSDWPTHLKGGDTAGMCINDLAIEVVKNNGTKEFVIDEAKCLLISSLQISNGLLPSNKAGKVAYCHNKTSNPDAQCGAGSALLNHLYKHDDTKPHTNDAILVDSLQCDGPAVECPDDDNVAQGPEKQLVGLRFEYVDVPQGAKITGAKIHFQSAAKVAELDSAATFVIQMQDSANALSFSDTPFDISNTQTRPRLDANVTWEVNKWYKSWYNTPDLAGLVQSVVNRQDWCGGQSMAFIINGDENGALHRVWSADYSDPSVAPRLEISYETTSDTVGCLKQSTFLSVTKSEDDAEETLNTGAVYLTTDEDILELGEGGGSSDARAVGLRFENTPVRKNATIESAHLILHAQPMTSSSNADLVIEGELASDSESFADSSHNISSRPRVKTDNGTDISVAWPVTDSWLAGRLYKSQDITTIVQQLVKQDAWNENANSMTFIVTGTGQRKASAFEAGSAMSAQLHVQVDGYLEEISPMDKVEHDLEIMMDPDEIDKATETAIVDALYEAAMYYRGGEVTYGKDRDGYEKYLISHPESYTVSQGDKVDQRPDICEAEPFNKDCKNEHIPGSEPTYVSPIPPCQTQNHIVLLTDGSTSVNQSETKIASLIGGQGCQTKWEDNSFEEIGAEKCGASLAKFLNENDHLVEDQNDRAKNKVTTSTIFLSPQNVEPHAVDFMSNLAKQGGGQYYPVKNIDKLTDTLKQVVVSISEEAASFAPTGLSVNRFNRLVHNEEVYYALFKHAKKRAWEGNVKKYKFALVSDASAQCERNKKNSEESSEVDEQLCLVGQDGEVAIKDQAISEEAKSFWPENRPDADGPAVTKGGVGERLLTIAVEDRKVFTHVGMNPTSPTELTLLGSTDLTGTDLTEMSLALTDAELAALHLTRDEVEGYDGLPITVESQVNWILGQNRDWRMAEPLHSSPQAISYAPPTKNADGTTTQNTKVFFGTNDGLVRSVDAETGMEDWAFLPQELFNIQAALMINPTDADLTNHIYGMDGTPAFWVKDSDNTIKAGDGDFVRLFIGERRGGRDLYALDVTDTEAPKLMWVIKGGEGQFANLGQTWSFPRPVRVHKTYCLAAGQAVESNNSCVALLFGGGYDTNQDSSFGEPGNGSAIYMVHAKTGELLWWASSAAGATKQLSDMKYPIPSDLTALDSDGNGKVDRVYVGDVAGQVWRIDLDGYKSINGDYVDQSRGDRLAVLASTSTTNQRRFFHPPDWTRIKQDGQIKPTEVVTIVSGNHVHPKDKSVQDRIYVLVDAGWQYNPVTDQYDMLNTVEESDLNALTDLTSTIPWYLDLPDAGEKGLGSPAIMNKSDRHILLATSYTPVAEQQANTCVPQEGVSKLYAVDLVTGAPAFDTTDCTGDECTKFDTENSGDEAKDRSIELKKGIANEINLMFTNQDVSALVGTERLVLDEDRRPKRAFWLQADD